MHDVTVAGLTADIVTRRREFAPVVVSAVAQPFVSHVQPGVLVHRDQRLSEEVCPEHNLDKERAEDGHAIQPAIHRLADKFILLAVWLFLWLGRQELGNSCAGLE